MSLKDPLLPWDLRGQSLVLQVLRLWLAVEKQQFTFSPLPSLTCSSLWPQNCEDSWWKACAHKEVALAGEPAGPQATHLWWLPHQQMVGDDRSPLCLWVSAWRAGLGPLTRHYSLPLLLSGDREGRGGRGGRGACRDGS